jgi:tripartite-type tricarboxylate transporter receptor subunit TctC
LAGTLADPNVAADMKQLGIDPASFGPEHVTAEAEKHRQGWKDRMSAVEM